MTADCRDDKDIEKQHRRQNEVGSMLVRKLSFAPAEGKIQLFKSYCYPIYGFALWRHYFVTKLTVSYSDTFTLHCVFSDLPHAATRVRHTRTAAAAHSLEFKVSRCRTTNLKGVSAALGSYV